MSGSRSVMSRVNGGFQVRMRWEALYSLGSVIVGGSSFPEYVCKTV